MNPVFVIALPLVSVIIGMILMLNSVALAHEAS
jgi:hypothetical protein